MMENPGEVSHYLRTKLETAGAEEQKDPNLEQILATPLGEVSYQQEGNVVLRKPPLSLSFSYGPAVSGKIPWDRIEFVLTCRIPERFQPKKADFRQLEKFVLRNESTGKSLDLTRDLDRHPVLFLPKPIPELRTDCVIPSRRISKIFGKRDAVLISSGGPQVMGTIYTLLHELGHIRKANTKFIDENKEMDNPLFMSINCGRELKGERKAWADTLKRLAPLFSNDNPYITAECLRYYAHWCLSTYSKSIKAKLNRANKILEDRQTSSHNSTRS